MSNAWSGKDAIYARTGPGMAFTAATIVDARDDDTAVRCTAGVTMRPEAEDAARRTHRDCIFLCRTEETQRDLVAVEAHLEEIGRLFPRTRKNFCFRRAARRGVWSSTLPHAHAPFSVENPRHQRQASWCSEKSSRPSWFSSSTEKSSQVCLRSLIMR